MPEESIAGRYRLLEPLGRGAMSAVWLAHDDELDRDVAVKTLGPTADRERFEREAHAAAALSHPNICAVYDYGRTDEHRYLVLEYLPNGSLEDLLQRHAPLADEETRRIATDVAAGLEHAHERGLVHRDLKPANILFDGEQRAKIADFGIARLGGSNTLTETGTVLGTASYISPEQASGEPAGPQSDVYSFGVILYRMLTGTLPFAAQNAMELVRMHRDVPPPDVRTHRPDVPGDLAALTMAALAKDPAGRPADGHAVLGLLRAGDTEATLPLAVASAATEVTRVLPPRRRGRLAVVGGAAIAAVLLLAGVVLAVVLTGKGGKDSPPTTRVPLIPVTTASPVTTHAQTTTTTPATTTAPTTTRTAPTTTAPATTTAPTTTAETTTAATTTASTTTAPTTTAPTTTVATTTVAQTTPPTTTAVETTTSVATTTGP